MTRLEKWKTPRRVLTLLSGAPQPDVSEFFRSHRAKHPEGAEEGFSEAGIIGAARELIFEMRHGLPYFTYVLYTIDSLSLKIEMGVVLEELPPENATSEEIADHVRRTLAFATAHEVPVYPNSSEDEAELVRHHRAMLIEGFSELDESGQRKRFRLRQSPGRGVDSLAYLEGLTVTDTHSPAEIALIRDAIKTEIRKRDEAGRVLGALKGAIEELDKELSAAERNENKLQMCLTSNPVLFGPEYVKILPKHRLGAEFEVDYGLQRVSGLIDLVEIEASNHLLFTKGGNPTKELVHAEQQVLDWLDWCDRHGEYAREALSVLLNPVGYVVIGRRSSLDAEHQRKLFRRNATFANRIVILTYDDLQDRAKALLNLLLRESETTNRPAVI